MDSSSQSMLAERGIISAEIEGKMIQYDFTWRIAMHYQNGKEMNEIGRWITANITWVTLAASIIATIAVSESAMR